MLFFFFILFSLLSDFLFYLSPLPSLMGIKNKKTHSFKPLTVASFDSAIVLALSVVSVAIYLFRKIKNMDKVKDWRFELGPHRYSYQELKKASKGLGGKKILGSGGFSLVYKGTYTKLSHKPTTIGNNDHHQPTTSMSFTTRNNHIPNTIKSSHIPITNPLPNPHLQSFQRESERN